MAEVAEKLQVAHLKQCVKTKTTKPRSTYCSRITDWTMMRIETLVNYAVHANGYVNVPLLVTRGLLTNTRLNKSILFDVRGTGCPFTGDKGTPFGYNTSGCDTRDLLHPDPEKVASLLMRRREFQPSAANLWAAAWIQFMIHGWVEHKTNKNGEMIKGTNVPFVEQVGSYNGRPVTLNQTSHWWDASQLHGDDDGTVDVAIDPKTGLFSMHGPWVEGDRVGKPMNPWVGISLLNAAFAHEHNHLVDLLQKKEGLGVSDAYRTARLVVAALLAKIHTVEWTPQVFFSEDMKFAMTASWDGILKTTGKGEGALNTILHGSTELSETNNQGVPYSLTDDFSSVYRLHPMIGHRGGSWADKTLPRLV